VVIPNQIEAVTVRVMAWAMSGIGVFVRDRALVVTEAIEYLALPSRLPDVGEAQPPADVAAVPGRRSLRLLPLARTATIASW
jgi:hypothetical protein